MRIQTRYALFVAVLACAPAIARAQSELPRAVEAWRPNETPRIDTSMTDPLPDMSDEELDARQRYLDAAIATNAKLTKLWMGAWTEAYAAGLVIETYQAIETKSAYYRADTAFSAAKAGFGVISRIATAPRAVFGPTPEELYPGSSHAERARRLLAAESMLRIDAKQNDRRYNWISHTVNLALNLAGTLFVGLAYHNWTRGLESGAVGIAVGELSIWTQPWQAKRAYADYKKRYGMAGATAGRTVSLSPPGHIRPTGLFSFSF